ncbi:acetyl-CoA synthetase-like protein [Lepidopterella palustris CBS 459.81]|uniref:Acetyl-CoA synthetase-like protein n=1 Tax=Lepidopterella palustris CBS 459.81 TaxID=1314670 RepID=A0A8E2EKR4_9PEZI|nr:acetyl-CoA synthetase-like protein [Lepidopterella palustris CBS 459.81]
MQTELGPALSILNRHTSLLEGPRFLHELVQGSRGSQECAIDFIENGSRRTKISYQSLHELSDALAKRLRRSLSALDQVPAVIPVLLQQSPELYITLLAILKAGAAFCPLGLDAPEERLNFILHDVSAGIVVTASVLESKLPRNENLEVLLVDDHQLYDASNEIETHEAPLSPSDLAYLLYTSGSTGVPKAVAVSHLAVTQSLLAHDRHIPHFSRFLQFASPTFDVSIFEIFFTFFRRSTLISCTRSDMLNDLPGVIRRMNVDAIELTPTVVSNLLRGRNSVPGLKLLLTIGEMLTRPIVEEFGDNNTAKGILWGMYGPTEAAIHCTIRPNFQSTLTVGNIGFPLDTVSAYITAPLGQSPPSSEVVVLPFGQAGELVIGGPQIANEYLNRPELTTTSFILHQDYGRLYRTGDKARILPDGSIECLGRIISGQVKIRGQRVELGEIEQVILKLDGCLNVATSVIDDILVAFCLVDTAKISTQDVTDLCKRWLPSFMVPGNVVLLTELPQLPSGKIDKRKLEQEFVQMKPTSQQHEENLSSSMTHNAVLDILQRIFGRTVSTSAPLASIGLDSLISIRVASLLRTAGYSVGVSDVLSAIDVTSLSLLCDLKSQEVQSTSLAPSQEAFKDFQDAVLSTPELQNLHSDIEDVIPCTPLQEAMLAETAIQNEAYCNWVEIEFTNSHSFTDIKNFLNAVAEKNEILRSGFTHAQHSMATYAQIIWKSLENDQILETMELSYSYIMDSSKSLLRPLKIQVNTFGKKPRMLFQIPHQLYDGWSLDLILNDLSQACKGETLHDRPQFREVATFYCTIRDTSQFDSSKNYWKDLLNGYHPIPLPNFNGEILPSSPLRSCSRVSCIDLEALRGQALKLRMSPQVFFQAGLAYLLQSYLGVSDVVFGTITSGRTIPVTGIDEIVGPCIVSLPLRVSFSGFRTVGDLLESIQSSNRAMVSHCIVPLKEIEKCSGLQPKLHLFDVLFVWQESLQSHRPENAAVRLIDSADQLEFKLTLEIEPRHDCVRTKATYDPSIISDAQVSLLLRQLDEVVGHLIQHDDSKLDGLQECFSKSSLSIANPYPMRQHFDHGPAHAVETWARDSPEKPALLFGSIVEGVMKDTESIHYKALNARANKLAALLRDKGFGTDELICILMEKSIDLYISILAVTKLGLGYLPITPETPLERTRWILNEARVRVCLSQTSTSGPLHETDHFITIDVDGLDLSSYPDQNITTPYNGSNLAYAVFTSGSSGTPKGVLVTQDNLVSNLEALFQIYPAPEGSRLLQACSQAFDVSVFEIFFAWRAGMCLCSASKDDLFYDLEGAINIMGITHLSLTPTVAALVDSRNVPRVQFLVTAGEALTEHVRRSWAGKGLYQGYGPSETTNICTVKPNTTATDLINNIGPPLTNTSAFVLQLADNEIAPRGAVGELCFGGDQVCRGYLNMPELTAEKFIDHPDYGRIYRSGDLGRLLPDDSVIFLGRADDQVKIRGQRVELSEINSCILDFEVVRDCVSVLIQNDKQYSQKILTFWVPYGTTFKDFHVLPPEDLYSSAINDIFETLSSRLPAYMIPVYLIPVTEIPMTHQSKVDMRRLIATFESLSTEYLEIFTQHTLNQEDTSGWSPLEEQIVTCLSKVVGVPTSEIKRHSSFFSLGLDSISAISLSHALRASNISQAPVSLILRNPTVARLSSKLHTEPSTSKSVHDGVGLKIQGLFGEHFISKVRSEFRGHGKEIEKILPCTPLQEAMLSTGVSSMSSLYCNRMLFDLTGEVGRIQESWIAMFERHAILRTCFIATDNPDYAFAQVVLPHQNPEWESLIFETENLDSQIEQYVKGILPTLLDSYRPPVRLAIVNIGTSKLLLFCCHHAVYDGAAISQLLYEIEQNYLGSELPSVVPYELYLEHMISLNYVEADRFWSKMLADLNPPSFPSLTGRISTPKSDRKSYATVSKTLGSSLGDILGHGKEFFLSLLSITQAVWVRLLCFYLGEDDICFGNIVSGRTLPVDGLDRLVAPCFNTVPVRVESVSTKSNLDLMHNLQDINIASLPFQMTPLRRIHSILKLDRVRLFDTLFVLQQHRQELNDEIWTLKIDSGEMDVPLVCEISPNSTRNSLELTLHYHHSIVSDTEANIIVDTYNEALRSCINSPSPLAMDAENFPLELLSISNRHFSSFEPADGLFLHAAFTRNAELSPEATALDFQHADGSRTLWSYLELNVRSNRIAHALLEHGVSPEDIIPVCMPKCPLFYASILGILKAGAAFTPFDPQLPEARKQYMLKDLDSKVLLCTDETVSTWCQGARILDVTALEHYSQYNPIISSLRPTHLAYCLYTSGSTGRPKAVIVEHRNPVQTIESSQPLIPWTSDSRLLQYAATTFDMCYYDCFLAWSFGFCLCAAEQSMMLNNLTGIINSMNVSLLDLTPSVAASISKEDVPSVQYLYCIGESMRPEIVNQWDGQCVNSYGPTEAAFCCTISPVDKEAKASVIGRPFPTTSFAVYSDSGDHIIPLLGVGELYIGGSQIARGYYGNDQLTRSKFIKRDGQRLYKSGDIVRMLANGSFEFLGRRDDQVKIRGLRVELGEINHVLRDAHKHIIDVTVQILRKSDDARDQLVAFLVIRQSGHHTDKTEIKTSVLLAAGEKLPSYMVPNFLIFIDKVPLSPAGKVDRKTLTEVFCHSEEASLDIGKPTEDEHSDWSQIEKSIGDIFATLSRTPVERIQRRTTIYQLGLDSISAVQVAAQLRKMGYQASASDVLENPSCADLAAKLEKMTGFLGTNTQSYDFASFEDSVRTEICSSFEIRPEAIESLRPCTPLQKGFIAKFLQSEGRMYFNYLQLKLDQDVDLSRLHTAWKGAMQKHQMLRTGFAHVKNANHSFAMIIYTSLAINLPLDAEERGRDSTIDTDQWLRSTASQTLKFLHKPPWRVRIVENCNCIYIHLAIFHALYDGHGLQTILQDVAAIYRGQSGFPAQRIEPVLGEILNASNPEDETLHEYWREWTKGVYPTHFPSLSPLRSRRTSNEVIIKSCKKSKSELEAGCRTANITLQAAGQAAWARLLSAYIGEPTVTFGVVLSGRMNENAESVVFPCITTVPIVCRTNQSNRSLLTQIMAFNSSVQKYQFTALTEIQRLAGHPDEPLFDTIFAYQKLADEKPPSDPWKLVQEKASVEYSVSFEMEPLADELEIRVTFQSDVLPREQALILVDQVEALLTNIIYNSDQKKNVIIDYDPSLYSVTPAKDAEIDSDVTLLHQFVETSAKIRPEKIAFEFAAALHSPKASSQCWTYSELNAEGNRIAHLIQRHDVKTGCLVGICFDKCPQASFAILGILKAGCAFVALDPGAPPSRKAFITKDSGAKLLLSMSEQSTDLVGQLEVPIVNLNESAWSNLPATQPTLDRDISPQDVSYCLYTSGTTGTPKGCEITHENAVQAMLAFQRLFAYHWDAESRWLQFASFHFDVSVLEQYWSWSVGIRVVSAPRDLIFEDLAASIRQLGITHIDLTPSLARILHPDEVPSLCRGVFITGGEQLKQEILDVWGPKGVIYNGYGPTEATIGVTMYPRVPEDGKPSNIGPQFDNVGSYVLRPNSDIPVLRGAIGELCVCGKLVGKGYLNRQELTHERFPFLERFGERVYRTGDLVRILHDNSFDFLGRADDQVKLRGQRLEIGEIISIIKQATKSILDVAILVLKYSDQQKEQLVAFLVTKGSSKPKQESRILLETTAELISAKEACQNNLPGYMVPTHFVLLSSMPLSPNNKEDVKKLKEMYNTLTMEDLQLLSSLSNDQNDNWSQEEERIKAVLQRIVQVNANMFRKSSSIFELGLDSISVIGFSKELKSAGFSLAQPSLIMKNPSISRLARAIGPGRVATLHDKGSIVAARQAIAALQHRYKGAIAKSLGRSQSDIEAIAPCTPLQEGMIARSLDSDKPLYFGTFKFQLSGGVDISRLRGAWEKVYCNTQILRTKFLNTEDGFIQIAIQGQPLPWTAENLSCTIEIEDYLGNCGKQWRKENGAEFRNPFELIVAQSPGQTVLAVHIFHALYDGSSLPFVFDAVWEEYRGVKKVDYGLPFQSALVHGPLRKPEGAQEFWTQQLSGARFQPTSPLTSEPQVIDSVATRKLRPLRKYELIRRKLGVTHQALAQACWTTVLQTRIKGAVTCGIVVSGRSIDIEGADRTIGPLFNTVPFSMRFEKLDTWASVVKRCHDFNVSALPYQHTALRDITKWCKRTANAPLFDTLFVFQKGNEEAANWADNDLWHLIDNVSQADYPLAFEVEQQDQETLKLTITAQGHMANQESSFGLLEEFENALNSLLANPEALISESIGKVDESSFDCYYSSEMNGVTETPINESAKFEWTCEACKIRAEIARLANIDIATVNECTSILELGLDSIDAIKLSSRLKKRSINISVSQIMRGLTISKMLQEMSSCTTNKAPVFLLQGLRPQRRILEHHLLQNGYNLENVESVLPVTPLQEAMVAEMLTSDFKRYFNHDVLKITPGVDIRKLQDAWTRVVINSPILRTSFVEVDDPGMENSFVQLIHKFSGLNWNELDLDGEDQFPGLLEDIRKRAANKGVQAEVFQLCLAKIQNHSYIILSMTHALYDGWSLGLLHSDIKSAYHGHYQSRKPFDKALDEILNASGSEADIFWRDFLFGARGVPFPRRNLQDHENLKIHREEISSNVSLSLIKSFTKKLGITMQTLGQTVWSFVLASYIHNLEVVFGSVLSGRDDENSNEVMFPTMNTVAIRTILHGSRREMLQYVQGNFGRIRQHQHFPLRKAQALAGLQGTALFDTLFIYQKRPVINDGGIMSLYKSVGGASDVEYPVCVEMEATDDDLIWRCACKDEVLSCKETTDLLKRMDMVLGKIFEYPDAPTLEIVSGGISICGLPAFEDRINAETDNDDAGRWTSPDTSAWSNTERIIRQALSTVSKVPEDEIKKSISMFHLGLDSISAIKVSALLRKQSIRLSVSEMLRAATIENMGRITDGRSLQVTTSDLNPEAVFSKAMGAISQIKLLRQAGISPEDIEKAIPASAGQTYMLCTWMNSKGVLFYPEFKYRIDGSLSIDALRESWKALVASNTILRSCFLATGDYRIPFIQVVFREFKNAFRNDTEDKKEDNQGKTIEQGTQLQPYVSLSAQRSDQGWLLSLKIHHALYDGVSLPRLMNQLQDFCNDLKPTSLQSSAFTDLLASSALEENHKKREAFWTSYFSGMSSKHLIQPTNIKPSRVEIFRPAILPNVKFLEEISRKHGLSIQSIFLAVYAHTYAKLLAQLPGNSQSTIAKVVAIGVYLANRSHAIEGLSEVAAPTVNLVPLRVNTPLETSLLDSAAQIQHDLQDIGSLENSVVALWEIAEWTGIKIDTFVNFLKLPEEEEGGNRGLDSGIRIREARERVMEPLSRVIKPSEEQFVEPNELKEDVVKNTYLQAIDVEATAKNGSLDVGIFCPVDMLSLNGAEKMIADLRNGLMNLSGV